jgi:hypothetical protein
LQTTRPGSNNPNPGDGCTSTAEEDHCEWDTVDPQFHEAPQAPPENPLADLTPEQIAALSNQQVETLLAGLPADEIGQENAIYALPDAQRRAVNLRLMQFYNQTQAGAVSTGGENDEEVPVYAELTHVAGDLVTGELPILSQAQALATITTGVDPYSGEQVAGWDRVARLLDVLPGGRKLRQGGTLATASLGAFGFLRRHGDEAADAAGAAKRGAFVAPYEVGRFNKLESASEVGDDLALHHAGQKHAMSQIIGGYDPKAAPAIALPTGEHRAIPNLRGTYGGSARDLLARDVRSLRNNTNAPNSSLIELIDLNKELYPGSFSK